MNWPKSLIAELASRRSLVFLGAGASAGCVSADGYRQPPTWNQLLKNLIDGMSGGADKDIIDDYISKEKYLDAAEIIINNTSTADFSRLIRQEFVSPRYKPSKIHECIQEIDPKVVVTTNYDSIYENYCATGAGVDGYNVSKYYDSHIVSDLRSPVRLIVKAHGCISDPSKVVLTRSQYFKAKQECSNFYKVLDALFLTHTILFVGYSLTDPDIQLVLENSTITAPNSHPHYLVIGDNLNPAIKDSFRKAYNIEFIEFKSGDYDELNAGLEDLSEEVKQFRLTNPST